MECLKGVFTAVDHHWLLCSFVFLLNKNITTLWSCFWEEEEEELLLLMMSLLLFAGVLFCGTTRVGTSNPPGTFGRRMGSGTLPSDPHR